MSYGQGQMRIRARTGKDGLRASTGYGQDWQGQVTGRIDKDRKGKDNDGLRQQELDANLSE